MAYNFKKDATAKFKFRTNQLSDDTLTLNGINASLSSADTICDGISSLMAIGLNEPVYTNAVRTATETVERSD